MIFTLRAAAYVRVAAADGETEQRLLEQERRIRAWAKPNYCEIVKVYADIGSGVQEQRPGLMELMAAAEEGEFDVLLITHHARLFRDRALLRQYLTQLRNRYGVEVICVDPVRPYRAGYVPRAVGYARVETEENAEARLAEQEGLIRAWAGHNNNRLVTIYRDIGPDDETQRPGLQQLLAAAEAGELDYVVLTDTTRLFGDLELRQQYDDLITQKYQVTFVLLSSEGGVVSRSKNARRPTSVCRVKNRPKAGAWMGRKGKSVNGPNATAMRLCRSTRTKRPAARTSGPGWNGC